MRNFGAVDEQAPVAYRAQEEPTGTAPPPLASWWARAGAIVIDNLLMSIPLVIAVTCFVVGAVREDEGESAGSLWVIGGLSFFAYIIIPFLYFSILNGNERGQTLGKRATGIRVRRMDGSALGIGRALGRYSFVFFLGVLGSVLIPAWLVDYLWPLWDKRSQTLHDKVVDSVVVRA